MIPILATLVIFLDEKIVCITSGENEDRHTTFLSGFSMDLNTPFIQHRDILIVGVVLTMRWRPADGKWVRNLLRAGLIASLVVPAAAQGRPMGCVFRPTGWWP